MNKNITKKAFTLVELIVVITILAVLATVAFVSFQGYGVSSRDSVRLADLRSMEKVNDLYRLTNSRYPTPNESTGITYSGSTAWTQGVFGTNSYSSNTSLSNVPTDPITGLPYAYSVTNTKQEYQMAAVLEGEVSQMNTQIYAGDQIASVYVKGDYNGKFIKVHTGSLDYLLGVPSIIASDITSVDMMEIVDNQRLVYKGHNNLPASYSGSIYNNNGGFNFTPNQVVLFEGNISDLETDINKRTDFLDSLQINYGGTEIASETEIAEVLAVDSSSSSEANNYVANVLNNSLNTNIGTVEFIKKLTLEDIKIMVEEISTMVHTKSLLAGNTTLSSNNVPKPTITLDDGSVISLNYGYMGIIVSEWNSLLNLNPDDFILHIGFDGTVVIYPTELEGRTAIPIAATFPCIVSYRAATVGDSSTILLNACID